MATPEEEVGARLGGIFPQPRLGGAHTGPIASSKASLKIDNRQIKDMNKELKETVALLEKGAKWWQKWGLNGRGNTMKAQNGQDIPTQAPMGNATRDMDVGGVYNRNQMKAFGAFAGIQAAAGMMGAVDNRIDRGANYALTADRYNVMMQQQYGLSQNQVMNQMRKPLANYRMGPDGINAMMGFQQQTGFTATQQLTSSLSGIRAITGYAKTAQDVVNDQMSIMDPSVANRMLYMTGANAYTFGGGLNDPMKMRQQIVQSMGLTNASILKGAKGPGSVTRARMADAGISEEMQTEILSYAQSNLTFQQKGGKGMYDPSKKADRKLMGIEDNYATQVEETERLRQSREESFSRRQLDNFASMEKMTQSMVRSLASIEDSMSALVGQRVSGRGWMKPLGSLLQVAGGIAAFTPLAPAALPLMAGGSLLSGAAGDPTDADGRTSGTGSNGKSSSANDAGIMVPYGYNGDKVPLSQLKSKQQFSSLDSRLQSRLLNMFRANPGRIGIGGGGRSEAQQRQLFLSRYRKTSKKTKIFWEGSYWEHVSGAAAAPPGRSMHEIGLAADLVGDMDWLKANASKFGLRSFHDVNNEPWHVQPSELPGSRREYEKAGAPWGGGSTGEDEQAPAGTTDAVNEKLETGGAGAHGTTTGFSNLRDFSGLTMSDIVSAIQAGSGDLLGLNGGTSSASSLNGGTRPPNTTTIGDTPVAAAPGSGAMYAARLAYDAGFRGEDLYKMIAIAGRESGWNPSSKNPNTSDRGLWQINWAANGETMMKELGVKGPEGMFDPVMNAKGARLLWERAGFFPWKASREGRDHKLGTRDDNGWDPQGNEMYHTESFQAQARAAATAVEKGDPTWVGGVFDRPPSNSKPTSGNVSVSPTYQITVAPQITFMGTPQTPDLRKIAQEVTSLIEQNVRTLEMRGA